MEDVCLAAPQNQKIWRKEGQTDTKMAVKCYYRDEIVIFRGEAIRYAQVRSLSLRQRHGLSALIAGPSACVRLQINKLIENTWHTPMKLKHINTDEEKKWIRNATDWKKVRTIVRIRTLSLRHLATYVRVRAWVQAVKESNGNVRVHLSKRMKDIPEHATKGFDCLSVVVVLADWDGVVLFANKAVKTALGKDREVFLHRPSADVRRPVPCAPSFNVGLIFACCIPRQLFPGIELSVSGEWKQLEALGKKKRKIALRYTVSMYDEMTYLIQAVPHSE